MPCGAELMRVETVAKCQMTPGDRYRLPVTRKREVGENGQMDEWIFQCNNIFKNIEKA